MPTQHRGIKLLELADGRHVARFIDPISRRQVQVSLDRLGLTNARSRRLWAIAKTKVLQALRAQVSLDGTAGRVTVKNSQTDYLDGFDNRNSRSAKQPALASITAFLADRSILEVQDITAPLLAAWGDHVRRPGNPHLPSTRNWHLLAVGAWLRWCRRRGLTPRLTDDAIKDSLRRQKAPRDAIEVLRPAQVRDLLKSLLAHDATERDQIGAFALMVLLTGCRFSEAMGLSWAEVDLEAQVLRLSSGRTKTKTAREVTLAECPAALALLGTLRLRGGHGRVFPGITRGAAEAARTRLVRDYGAPTWTWHMLRRTCGSLLVCGGILGSAGPFLTAKRLGHSVAVSEKHYLGAILGLPKDATTIEQAAGIEAEAKAIIRAVGQMHGPTQAAADVGDLRRHVLA